MIKKTVACILIALICFFSLAGCSDDGIPDGMKSATREGEPFILYVPESWYDNRDSGISSAYYSLSDALTVNARYYTPYVGEGESFVLADYVNRTVTAYNEKYSSFKLVSNGAATLGGAEAIRLEFTFERPIETNGVTENASVTSVQYFTLHATDVVMLSFFCRSSAYANNEDYAEMLSQITSEFVLCDKKTVNDEIIDEEMPAEGIKRISFDDAEYRFYAPLSWVSNMSDNLTEAYYPESGRPNVSVTSYSPDTDIDAYTYYELCEKEYKKELSGYELISKEDRTVAEKSALSFTYKAIYGGAEYRIMQTVLVRDGIVYSVTYTALGEESFNAHLADVELMLSYFSFC